MELYSSAIKNRDEETRKQSLGTAKFQEETGFIQNFDESFRLDLREGLSISSLVHQDAYNERKNILLGLYNEGIISKDIVEQHTSVDVAGVRTINYNTLGKWTTDNLDVPISTDEEIKNNIYDELALKREIAERVGEHKSAGGVVGSLLGTMSAALIDPLLLPTYFVGLGPAARGATWLTRFLRSGVKVAKVEAGFEVIRQPNVYGWKKEIGADYNAVDAITQIAAAGIGAGVLGGLAGSLVTPKNITIGTVIDTLESAIKRGKTLAKAKNMLDDPTYKETVATLENTLSELKQAPIDQTNTMDHLLSLEGAVAEQESAMFKGMDSTLEVPKTAKVVEPSPESLDVKVSTIDEDGVAEIKSRAETKEFVDDINTAITKCPPVGM